MLKSLELFGFKSFADRTRFDFAPGITGVVGPNGSGKSNVVDAIKWILGDQSAKSLRGKEMADVIFNGAAGRKPANLAEATLTFDNASGFLPADGPEVQIGRRLWRSGDSEYLLNQAPARLKDVRDLFLGTGAGTAAYNIIEQGRVDQILQANAVSRRAIFEEAAGISRFRQRRTEALRKLERVDQNLLRLTDIVDEAEARLNSLRTQAAKAAKFRELSDELRAAWLGLAADDHRHLSTRLAGHERTVADSDAQLDQLHTRRQELETALASLDLDLDAVDSRLRRVEHRRATIRESIARHESTVRHQASRRTEVGTELVRLRGQRSTTAERSREADVERQRLAQQLATREREFADRRAQLDERRRRIEAVAAEITSARQTLETHRRDLPDRIREVTAAATRLNALQAELRAARAAKQNVAAQRRQIDQQTVRCRAECERRDLAAADASAAVETAAARVQTLRHERSETDGRRSQLQETLTELREKRSAADARKSVLDDLERRQQGLGIGVREILSRARTSHYPPWNQIRGSVADLLDVDLEHAALLEVALGPRSQLLVIEDVEPLLEYLAQGVNPISGRVGFVTAAAGRDGRLAPFSVNELPRVDLSGHEGVTCRADRLVRAPADLDGLAERLLADTWIADTLDRAIELSAGEGRGCRFVTLAGEVLEADGTLVVGSPRSDSAIVWRKSELRSIRDELTRLDERIAAEERRLRTLAESLVSAESELERAEAELQQHSDRHVELKAAALRQREDLDRLVSRCDELDIEAARLDGDDHRLTAAIHAAANEQ
ncbi:MAG TPA: chromosome segregation protein SMC, partial [Planctomycetaceae bacterium]|nr:chromosome segregation protein SMC [Planctomycetaceae bacterium]